MSSPPAHPDPIRVRLAVSGRVQGVAFRAATQRAAIRLRVAGWVRNRPDGSVEILAQGSPLAIDELTTWCRQGPPAARVDRVAVQREIVQDDLHGFRIRT
jgi:acylphosphatase